MAAMKNITYDMVEDFYHIILKTRTDLIDDDDFFWYLNDTMMSYDIEELKPWIDGFKNYAKRHNKKDYETMVAISTWFAGKEPKRHKMLDKYLAEHGYIGRGKTE